MSTRPPPMAASRGRRQSHIWRRGRHALVDKLPRSRAERVGRSAGAAESRSARRRRARPAGPRRAAGRRLARATASRRHTQIYARAREPQRYDLAGRGRTGRATDLQPVPADGPGRLGARFVRPRPPGGRGCRCREAGGDRGTTRDRALRRRRARAGLYAAPPAADRGSVYPPQSRSVEAAHRAGPQPLRQWRRDHARRRAGRGAGLDDRAGPAYAARAAGADDQRDRAAARRTTAQPDRRADLHRGPAPVPPRCRSDCPAT